MHKSGIDPIKNNELSTSIKGRSNLYVQMRDIMENASESVYISSSAYELMSKQKMFTEVFEKLKKRKVDVKVMIADSDEEAKKVSKKLGVLIKSKTLNARFVIVDRNEIIFTIKPTSVHEDFDYGVWINSEYFATSMAYMFELAWRD